VIGHHTSYYTDEETVPLCRSCHLKVHRDPDHEYYPSNRPGTIKVGPAVRRGLERLARETGSNNYKFEAVQILSDWLVKRGYIREEDWSLGR